MRAEIFIVFYVKGLKYGKGCSFSDSVPNVRPEPFSGAKTALDELRGAFGTVHI